MKPRILIIADDLTGAAELGGIALEFGLSVSLLLEVKQNIELLEDVTIVDSDTRNMKPAEARKVISILAEKIDNRNFDLIYKKTDSVLRGPVATEINTLLESLGKKNACLIPANPLKGRTIRKGKYYIGGIPINRTDFRSDPRYPRKSSYIEDLVSDNEKSIIRSLTRDKNSGSGKIWIPDIPSENVLQNIVRELDYGEFLCAGAADFFREILRIKFQLSEHQQAMLETRKYKHFIIGSFSSEGKKTLRYLKELNYSVFRLPSYAIEKGKSFDDWVDKITGALKKNKQVAVSGPYNRMNNPEKIDMISSRIVTAAKILSENYPEESYLFMEGGETASQFFRSTGWSQLVITDVIDAGVIALEYPASRLKVIIKPGSYLWPDYLLNKQKINK